MLILLVFIQVLLRDDGVRADCGLFCGAFPHAHPLHLDVIPYHIGNGWFGGMLPLTATALVAAKGDIYAALVPGDRRAASLIIGAIFIRETRATRFTFCEVGNR